MKVALKDNKSAGKKAAKRVELMVALKANKRVELKVACLAAM